MMSTLGGGDFELAVRQQPKYACVAIGKGKERKPIDPPPIVQLMVNPRKDPGRTFLQNPYLILTARLIRKGDEDQDEQAGPKESDLTGTLVSSLYSLKDTDNSQGGFFVFGDLSVRRVGTYRLAFILYELKLAEKECWLLSRTVSDPFVVYATKTFPGLAESTFLTRSFSDQGVRLRLRKDSRTVSTKKRTISQTDQIRTSHGIHGYLPHDGNHDLSPNGHSPHHHLRRLSSLQDPTGMGPGHLDRARSSMGSQGSYYTDSPQLRSAGDYTPTSYGYGYDDTKPSHKRARMDGTSPDSPHPGYEPDTTAYHPYAQPPQHHHHHQTHPHHHQHSHHHQHPHAAATTPHTAHHPQPRTVPDSLASLYPLTTTTSYPLTAAVSMPSPFASMPRLDTTHLPPHSPAGGGGGGGAPGSATSAFSPGTRRSPVVGGGGGGAGGYGAGGGYAASPTVMYGAPAGAGAGGVGVSGVGGSVVVPTSLPYHHGAAAEHHAAAGAVAAGLGIGLGGLEMDGR